MRAPTFWVILLGGPGNVEVETILHINYVGPRVLFQEASIYTGALANQQQLGAN